MARRTAASRTHPDWPQPPGSGREVVLHTRVVTETGGGPDKTILLSASYLADSPYWLAAAYMHPPDDPGFATLRQRAAAVQCPLVSVPDRGPLDRSVLRDLLGLCRHLDVRIWHGHDYKSNLLGLMLRPFRSMKLVTTLHGWVKHTSRTPLYYAVDRWSLPYYHHVICVSDDLMEQASRLGVAAERLSLIRNGIDERVFRRRMPAGAAPLRQKMKVPAGRLVIGGVGRLSGEKGFNHLIRATAALVGQGLDVECWIAGQGDAEAELRQLIEHLGMAERVRLLGFCEDTVGLYQALDLFVLSSLREGLPNVVLEAMATEVPVVATQVAGVPALIADGKSGLLVPIADQEALTAAIRRAVTSPGLRGDLAKEARRVIEAEYTFARRMQKEREVYDRVLAERPRRRRAAAARVGRG